MTMRSEAAWSYLDARPVHLYDPKFDAHLTYWNGVAMTKTYALIIYSLVWLKTNPTITMKKFAWEEYNRIYRSGGFNTREWDSILNNIYNYNFHNHLIQFILKKDSKFFNRLSEQYTAKQALEWFYPSKELIPK